MTLNTVSGKVAIVTGGGSGIGLAFVRLLQSRNCNVVIGDLCLIEESKVLVEESAVRSVAKVLFKETDVSDWKQLGELFSFTESHLGVPDIVCPGAGVFEPKWSNFWEDSETDSYKTIAINCEHPVKATRLAIRAFLKADKPGVIVHISSTGAQVAALNIPIYCSSKAFISHFVRTLASLQAENIKVVAVAPGAVNTPLWSKWDNEGSERGKSDRSAWASPAEIAKVMLALCEDSQYQGGTVLEAYGGGRIRRVEMLNDPGPSGADIGVDGRPKGLSRDDLNIMQEEIQEHLARERGNA
ncbi:NAD(P)-binding protein [Pseudovirgaria hyperparasitica]|uniref:NAD(P)-binding protein n=1 Tax=Pseudovirgaria hyperparasitica TaxID=470096 RepID=A0A6A6VVJ4_9PEZI|nr:NAD(P)-binding protein [Pseudovirgaria hyperparasitica]KAF2753744.1 NAD(P)-binding protein [Pseudovirgaria hyperparasitica]